MQRRNFLGMFAGAAAGAELPRVTKPRATSGDAVEPAWTQMQTITVGPAKADLVGSTDKVLQAAVDYAARYGGGTVQVLPGAYRLRNAVYLRSGVRMVGSGAESVLIKEPSVETRLAADSDWYDQEITLADARGFEVGDGVCLRARNPDHSGSNVLKRTLVARNGNRFKLDRPLRENFWLLGQPTVSTLFPILSGENISGVTIENLALDGNKANNGNLDGNYAGCIFLQDCNQFKIRGVEARHFNGDGISWQVCHDFLVENCHSHDHTGLGLHPGSGSQRPLIRHNRVERTDIGIFFCWGVKYGLAEDNVIHDVRKAGISIGHRDTDNLVRRNEVARSGEFGVLFRAEQKGHDAAGHRNRIEENRVLDSGGDAGVAVDVQGETRSIEISRNEIRETRGPAKRIGVRIGARTQDVKLAANRIEGFAQSVADLRSA
ncbi:MAG: right-handed parallel beta-helix repeat-containing protein [Candidatus Solibacter usitatus]|nr:right-handed parallel beta-helix repeat-containing protein [Candidatus Solibacter usitatus]